MTSKIVVNNIEADAGVSTVTVIGDCQATSFKGDGSQLTGISAGVSLANGADNRVVTATGAAALNGEANLTFNSSLVVTDGNGTVTTGGNYINLKRTSANTNYINAPLANADLVISADENLLFHTVHTGDFNSTERVRIDSSGRILQGSSTGRNTALMAAQPTYQLEGVGSNASNFGIFCNSNASAAGGLIFGKTRGTTVGGTTVVQDNDSLGHISFEGSDGSAQRVGARISAAVDGAVSGGGAADMPGRLMFFTTGDGSASETERFRITGDGHVLPGANNTYDIGSTSLRWRNIYTTDLQLSNEGKTNDVDGTWGDYTIQEGESDLFLINNRSGKKYRFMLQEVS